MRDDRLVEVDIAKLLLKPLCTVRAVAYPATEALGRGPGGGVEEGFVVIGLQTCARNVSGLCYFDACLGFLAIGL